MIKMPSRLLLKVCLLLLFCEIGCGEPSKQFVSQNGNQQRALDFTIQVCTRQGNCQSESVGLVMDYSYFCDDPTTCFVVNKSLFQVLTTIIFYKSMHPNRFQQKTNTKSNTVLSFKMVQSHLIGDTVLTDFM